MRTVEYCHRIVFIGLALLAVSCTKRQDDEVVCQVRNHILRAGELERRAGNVVLAFAHRAGSRWTTNQQVKIVASFKKGYASIWVEDRLIEDELRSLGVEVPQELVTKMESRAFANFKAKGDKRYEDLLSIPGLDAALWADQVLSEARREALRDQWAKIEPARLSPTYADDEIAKMKAYNARMAITNVAIYARATNTWQRLKAGADFESLGRAVTEIEQDREEGLEWTTLTAEELKEEPVLGAALKGLKAGQFTPPVEADNGLLIARVDDFNAENGSYELSRIFFCLPMFLTPASKAEIVAAAEREYAEDLFKKKLSELVQAAGVKKEK